MNVVRDQAILPSLLLEGVSRFVEQAVPHNASVKLHRVARRFGIVAAAGDLATFYGLTGWNQRAASDAALVCFRAWLAEFGSANREDVKVVEQVRHFIELHHTARFKMLGDISLVEESYQVVGRIYNQAGYIRRVGRVQQYLFTREVFRREVVEGYDPTQAARALKEARMLICDGDNRLTYKVRLPDHSSIESVYCVVLPEVEND